jgi:hypothetical protein
MRLYYSLWFQKFGYHVMLQLDDFELGAPNGLFIFTAGATL